MDVDVPGTHYRTWDASTAGGFVRQAMDMTQRLLAAESELAGERKKAAISQAAVAALEAQIAEDALGKKQQDSLIKALKEAESELQASCIRANRSEAKAAKKIELVQELLQAAEDMETAALVLKIREVLADG